MRSYPPLALLAGLCLLSKPVQSVPPLLVQQNSNDQSFLQQDSSVLESSHLEPLKDEFWIHKLSSIGDSYSAGLGAGSRIDFLCSRYNRSYPALISNDGWTNQVSNLSFQFLACSGATSGDILRDQVPKLEDGQDAVTVSAGGNDIGLSTCLNDCIFGWLPTDPDKCDQTLNKTEQMINNDLLGNLDELLSAVKPKLSKHGRVYYTGYAKFFDDTTSQCDSVSWDVWPRLYLKTNNVRLLTEARRKWMNDLADLLNQQLKAAVERNLGEQGVFVDYDGYYTVMEGRYCEDQVKEPSPLRPELLFYERGTSDPKYDSSNPDEGASVDDSTVADGTFEGQIASWIAQTLTQHPELKTDLEGGLFEALSDGERVNLAFAAAENSGADIGTSSSLTWFFPDTMKRVFHPRPLGHAVIADLVLWHMKQERAKMLDDANERRLNGEKKKTSGGVFAPFVKVSHYFQEVVSPCTYTYPYLSSQCRGLKRRELG